MAGALALGVGGFSLETTRADAQSPKKGGTLTFAISAEPPHYDGHGSDTFATLHLTAPFYSTLLKFDLDHYPNVIGDLAQSYTVSPDKLTYTFKLHSGVKFHDGTPLHLRRRQGDLRSAAQPAAGVVSTRKATFGDIASIETPDPLTVVFKIEGGERGDPSAFRLALELHLFGEGPGAGPELAEDPHQRHRSLRVSRARQGQPCRRQAQRKLLQEGPALSRRLQGRVLSAGSDHAQRVAGRTGAGRVPQHFRARKGSGSYRPWATRSASRSRAGRSICWWSSTSKRSRSTTCACAGRWSWPSTAGAAARDWGRFPRCVRSAACCVPVSRWRRRRRSWSSCRASPRTSPSRARKPRSCWPKPACRT